MYFFFLGFKKKKTQYMVAICKYHLFQYFDLYFIIDEKH